MVRKTWNELNQIRNKLTVIIRYLVSSNWSLNWESVFSIATCSQAMAIRWSKFEESVNMEFNYIMNFKIRLIFQFFFCVEFRLDHLLIHVIRLIQRFTRLFWYDSIYFKPIVSVVLIRFDLFVERPKKSCITLQTKETSLMMK